MKRRTLWTIGITTAIVTVVGLHTAFGSRYRMHHGFYNHQYCMQHKSDGENKTTPATTPTGDSTNRR
ncbi:MAG: hypothetical protein ABUT20_02900 [Bacteroidota bacterium]